MNFKALSAGLIAVCALGLAACSNDDGHFRHGEWQWDITITRDGQDFLDQSTDCMTISDAEAGLENFVRDYASAFQCSSKFIDVDNNQGQIIIDDCIDKYVSGVFTIKRRSARSYTVDGDYDYRDGGKVGAYQMRINATHSSDVCRLNLD